MPIRPNPNLLRTFRPGLPNGPDGRERPVPAMFPTSVAPGLYPPGTASPYDFNLPAAPTIPGGPPLSFKIGPGDGPATVVGQNDNSTTGERLPLGKPVGEPFDYRTGLYESVHTPPAFSDPVGGPKAVQPPSRYTMASSPAAGFSPGGDISRREFNQNATALALQQIYSGGAGGPAGGTPGRGASAAQAGEMDELGNTGRVLSAAAGLQGMKLQMAADAANGRPSARTFNARGEMLDQGANAPVGTTLRSDIEFSPFDTPEIRYRKTAYAEKRIQDAARNDPALSGGGEAPDTGAMANVFHRLMMESGQPRLKTLGNDAEGRPVEGTVDRNGNFSRIAPDKKPKSKDDQPEYSNDGKFYRSGPADDWKPVPASHDKPLSVTEWLMSGKPEGTYKGYRDAFQRESATLPADATTSKVKTAASAPANVAPAAATAAPTVNASAAVPQAIYRHEDVLAEMQRRGLTRK